MHLTAFCDMLGTKSAVHAGRFSEMKAFDFTGAVGGAASMYPFARFAAFSDCVIFSVPADKAQSFIEIIHFLWGNWTADGIWVRGGVDLGEVHWVDFEIDRQFSHLPNLSISRVYGKAVVGAYEIEGASGPGMIPFASSLAAEHISTTVPGAYLPLGSSILQFCPDNELDRWKIFISSFLSRERHPQERKHLEATLRVINLFIERRDRDKPDEKQSNAAGA